MHISPEFFGYAGMVTGVSFLLPQVWKSWKTKRVGDISWGMLTLLALNSILWFLYGLLLGSAPLMLCNGVAFLTVILQISLKARYS